MKYASNVWGQFSGYDELFYAASKKCNLTMQGSQNLPVLKIKIIFSTTLYAILLDEYMAEKIHHLFSPDTIE